MSHGSLFLKGDETYQSFDAVHRGCSFPRQGTSPSIPRRLTFHRNGPAGFIITNRTNQTRKCERKTFVAAFRPQSMLYQLDALRRPEIRHEGLESRRSIQVAALLLILGSY